MILTINGKNYELKFGLGFLAEMNKRHSAEIEGVQVGYGSMKLINLGLNLQDPLAIVDLIRAATAEAPQKPSNEDLERFVEEQILNNTFSTTFNAIFDELKKSPTLAFAMGIEAKRQGLTTVPPVDAIIPTQIVSPS